MASPTLSTSRPTPLTVLQALNDSARSKATRTEQHLFIFISFAFLAFDLEQACGTASRVAMGYNPTRAADAVG
jgi:hypothetical protein